MFRGGSILAPKAARAVGLARFCLENERGAARALRPDARSKTSVRHPAIMSAEPAGKTRTQVTGRTGRSPRERAARSTERHLSHICLLARVWPVEGVSFRKCHRSLLLKGRFGRSCDRIYAAAHRRTSGRSPQDPRAPSLPCDRERGRERKQSLFHTRTQVTQWTHQGSLSMRGMVGKESLQLPFFLNRLFFGEALNILPPALRTTVFPDNILTCQRFLS